MYRIIATLFFSLTIISLAYASPFGDSSKTDAENILHVYRKLLDENLEERKSEVKNIADRTLLEMKKYNKNKENIAAVRYILYKFIQGNLIYDSIENEGVSNYKTPILDIFILKKMDQTTKIIIHADGRNLVSKRNNHNEKSDINVILENIKNDKGRFEGSSRYKKYRDYIRKSNSFSWQTGKISGVDGIYITSRYRGLDNYLIIIKYDKKIITDHIVLASNLLNTIVEQDYAVFLSTKECFILYHTLSDYIYKTFKEPTIDERKKIKLKFRDVFISTISPQQVGICNAITNVQLNKGNFYSSEKETTSLISLDQLSGVVIGVSVKNNNKTKIVVFSVFILLIIILIFVIRKIKNMK